MSLPVIKIFYSNQSNITILYPQNICWCCCSIYIIKNPKVSSRIFITLIQLSDCTTGLLKYLKYQLTRWLPTTSILVVIGRIYQSNLPIQMQLSEKPKTFSQIFTAFLESTLNFKHFEKNEPHSSSIFGVIDVLT